MRQLSKTKTLSEKANHLKAQQIVDRWTWEYNHEKPHRSLDDLTPEEYITSQLQMAENSILD